MVVQKEGLLEGLFRALNVEEASARNAGRKFLLKLALEAGPCHPHNQDNGMTQVTIDL